MTLDCILLGYNNLYYILFFCHEHFSVTKINHNMIMPSFELAFYLLGFNFMTLCLWDFGNPVNSIVFGLAK